MREYDLYVPRNYNDGSPVPRKKLKAIKVRLNDEFGGVSEFHVRKRGWWKLGGVTFKDKVTIFRVYGDDKRRARKFFKAMKAELQEELEQEAILVAVKKAKFL